MKINEGVEWAAHACLVLGALPQSAGLSSAALAHYHGVPPAYMAKQLQALSKAGIVSASRGVGGGYRLARPLTEISLLDIVVAIDGPLPAFRCSEIRKNGPCGAPLEACLEPCQIARSFHEAEKAMRNHLAATTLAVLGMEIVMKMSPERQAKFQDWLADNIN